MKKIILTMAILLFSDLSSQNLKNTFKTNATAYAFRNFNLTYEREITDKFAASITYGTMSKGSVPFVKTFLNKDDLEEIKDIEMANSALTVETRFYFGNEPSSGFYLAPYYRYSKMKINHFTYDFSYYDETTQNSTDLPLLMNGDINAHSFGIMIGNQWLLGKNNNWVLDLWIIGGHYGFSSGDVVGKSKSQLTTDQQMALKEDIESLDLPIIKYDIETNANGTNIKVDGPWAGLRSGIALGYRF